MNLKLPLGFALAIIAAIVFGYFCFLGFNFSSGGDTGESIVKAIIWTLFLLVLAVGLWRLKVVNGNFKTYFILEIIVLLLFIICAIFAYPKFATSFGVSSQKKEIQKELQENLLTMEKLYPTYESYVQKRVNEYDNHLQSLINNVNMNSQPLIDCGFILQNLDLEKKNKIFVLENELQPAGEYKNLKAQNLHWIENSKSNVVNWRSMAVVGIANNIDSLATTWRDELVKFSTFTETCETSEEVKTFDYLIEFKSVADRFNAESKLSPFAIIVVVVLYLVMLIPYFIEARNPKVEGNSWDLLKSIFKKRNDENVL